MNLKTIQKSISREQIPPNWVWWRLTVKRTIDLLLSGLALAVLLIPFLIISVIIRLDSKGPVIFRQIRIGKNGYKFGTYKFRTMEVGAQYKGSGIRTFENDPRVTRVGKVLRTWGLDELPQLINVFMGDMSVVGPRPTVEEQVVKYSGVEARRLLVKPGITGLAVIRGRNSLTWPERISCDLQYIENFSLLNDFKIMFMTFWVILVTKTGLHLSTDSNR